MPQHYEQAHPLSRNPKGWFALELSEALVAGSAKPVSALGRDLVVFRTAGGEVGVLDAYCPHLGAHLGHGGQIDGETIRCPFHRWAFRTDGRCVHIPYSSDIPARAALTSYPTLERNGAVLAWLSPDGTMPEWDVPDVPSAGWSRTRWLAFSYQAHIQEFAENGVDCAHFPIVHASERAGVDILDAVGLPFRFDLRTAYPGDGIGLPGQHIDVKTEWSLYGMGVFVGVSTAEDFGTQVRQVFHFTPVPGDEVLIRVAISVNLDTIPPEMLDEVHEKNEQILLQNFGEDREIWRHKRYLSRPALCASDGPFGTLRRWSRQFYPRDTHATVPLPTVDAAKDVWVATDPAPAPPSFPAIEASRTDAPSPISPSAGSSFAGSRPASSVHDTIFVQLPASFDAQAAAGRDFVVQYHITGPGGGLYNVTVADGSCTPREGEHGDPNVRVFVEADDWLRINAGTLNRAKAFMTGRLKVKGDMKLAYKLGDVFRG